MSAKKKHVFEYTVFSTTKILVKKLDLVLASEKEYNYSLYSNKDQQTTRKYFKDSETNINCINFLADIISLTDRSVD